jgi:DNA polymerase/3'-5' exonuclease PolX
MTFVDGHLSRDGVLLSAPKEDDLYRHLELPVIPPELREGCDEIEAADRGALPGLVST